MSATAYAGVKLIDGTERYETPQGHTIEAHAECKGIESAYVSVHDTDGRFLVNYPMDSTKEATIEAFYVAYAYAAGHPY